MLAVWAVGKGLEIQMARLAQRGYAGGIDVGVGGKRFKLTHTDGDPFVDVPDEAQFVEPLLAAGFYRIDGADEPGYVERRAQEAIKRNVEEGKPALGLGQVSKTPPLR